MHSLGFRDDFSARTKYRSELAIAIWSNAMYAPTFEDETLGGFVMFDMFQAILDTKLLLHVLLLYRSEYYICE
jgi:hypothetical protein